MRHFWISWSYATILISHDETKVTMAPPIARWTLGKDPRQVLLYYLRKRATIREVFL